MCPTVPPAKKPRSPPADEDRPVGPRSPPEPPPPPPPSEADLLRPLLETVQALLKLLPGGEQSMASS
ncbi:hypothetical protein MTO96_037594 [Rhipicephalus appendiculatus]